MIFALIGRSGCGKSTLASILSNRLSIPNIISYTTRPKRIDEMNQFDYNFISNEEFLKLYNDNSIVAMKYIEANDWYYGYDLGQINKIINSNKNMILVITPDGYKELKEKFGDKVCSILIKTNEKEMITRCLKRDRGSTAFEICRRFISDEKDYKDFKGDFEADNDDDIDNTICFIEGLVRGYLYAKK